MVGINPSHADAWIHTHFEELVGFGCGAVLAIPNVSHIFWADLNAIIIGVCVAFAKPFLGVLAGKLVKIIWPKCSQYILKKLKIK